MKTLFRALLYFLSQLTWYLLRWIYGAVGVLVTGLILLALFLICIIPFPEASMRYARIWWRGIKDAIASGH